MTTNQNHIPEPTSPTEVVVGKLDGVTVVAAMMADHGLRWVAKHPNGGYGWRSWPELREELTDIRVVPVDEESKYGDGDLPYGLTVSGFRSYLDWRGEHYTRTSDIAVKPEPWLRDDELKAIMPTLKEGDVVEVKYKGHTATGELWAHSPSGLSLWSSLVRTSDGNPSRYVDALRIIERAPEPEPEPGAGIPDEVVDEALDSFMNALEGHERPKGFKVRNFMRAALAAADAKRAELEGQA